MNWYPNWMLCWMKRDSDFSNMLHDLEITITNAQRQMYNDASYYWMGLILKIVADNLKKTSRQEDWEIRQKHFKERICSWDHHQEGQGLSRWSHPSWLLCLCCHWIMWVTSSSLCSLILSPNLDIGFQNFFFVPLLLKILCGIWMIWLYYVYVY